MFLPAHVLIRGFVIDGLVRPGECQSDQLGRVPGGNSAFVQGRPRYRGARLIPKRKTCSRRALDFLVAVEW